MVGRHRPRNLLHRNKLDDFKKWVLDCRGYFELPPSGHAYEVFRFRKHCCSGSLPDIVFYQKDRYQHVTLDDEGEKLVKKWLKERKDAKRNQGQEKVRQPRHSEL